MDLIKKIYDYIVKLTFEENINIKDAVIEFINESFNSTKNVFELLLININQDENAKFLFAFFNYHGIETIQDCEKSFIYFLNGTKNNHILSLYYTATCYEFGHGIIKNLENSYKYYKILANQDYAIGQVQIGYFYQMGYHVDKNYDEAEIWYKLAVLQNNLKAKYNLGMLYIQNWDKKNEVKAFELFEELEEWKYIYGTFMLGYCYQGGLGVEKNNQLALKWYDQVVNNDSKVISSLKGKANYNIATIYYSGDQNVNKNINLAIDYFTKSASSGNSDAKKWLRDFNDKIDDCNVS